MSKIYGKVAAVTGAGSGIGRALALGLAKRGARLAVSDVNEAGLEETVRLVRAEGAEMHADLVDVSNRAEVAAWAQATSDRFGEVHQIYNNAGIAGASETILETDWAVYDRVLAINLGGVVNCTKTFLPLLIASGDGHVVNVSSLNGFLAQVRNSPYSASKFAVRGFTESLRAEMILAGHPVRVTVVHPGGVSTNIATSALDDAIAGDVDVVTHAHHERAKIYNEKLLKMPAVQAATIILDGVEAGRPRVLVGNDAKVIDLLVRLVPTQAPRFAAWLESRTFQTNDLATAKSDRGN